MAPEQVDATRYGKGFFAKNFNCDPHEVIHCLTPYTTALFDTPAMATALGTTRYKYLSAPSDWDTFDQLFRVMSSEHRTAVQKAFLEFVESKSDLGEILRSPPPIAGLSTATGASGPAAEERARSADALGSKHLQNGSYAAASHAFALASSTWEAAGGHSTEATTSQARSLDASAKRHEDWRHFEKASQKYIAAAECWRALPTSSEPERTPPRTRRSSKRRAHMAQNRDFDMALQEREKATNLRRSLPDAIMVKRSEARAADLAARIAFRDGRMGDMAK